MFPCTCDDGDWTHCPRHTDPYVRKERPMRRFLIKFTLPNSVSDYYAEIDAISAAQAVSLFSRDRPTATPTQVFKLEADVERTYTVKPIGSN